MVRLGPRPRECIARIAGTALRARAAAHVRTLTGRAYRNPRSPRIDIGHARKPARSDKKTQLATARAAARLATRTRPRVQQTSRSCSYLAMSVARTDATTLGFTKTIS